LRTVQLEPLPRSEVVSEPFQLQREHTRQLAERDAALGVSLAGALVARVLVGFAQMFYFEKLFDGGANLDTKRLLVLRVE